MMIYVDDDGGGDGGGDGDKDGDGDDGRIVTWIWKA